MLAHVSLRYEVFVCGAVRLSLHNQVNVVGRSSDCDIVIGHKSVSRRHAEIRWTVQEVTISDLCSRNGTFVDGTRVDSISVCESCRLRFGDTAFSLIVQDNSLGDQDVDDATGEGLIVQSGIEYLSDAQRRVFNLLMCGHPDKHIARELGLSVYTVQNHLRAIYRATNVKSRSELLASMMGHHLMSSQFERPGSIPPGNVTRFPFISAKRGCK